MGNSPSKILSRLRSKGHITDEEYDKLKNAITVARDENEPTTFIGDRGAYDRRKRCVKCGFITLQCILNDTDAKYCPNCGRKIKELCPATMFSSELEEVD